MVIFHSYVKLPEGIANNIQFRLAENCIYPASYCHFNRKDDEQPVKVRPPNPSFRTIWGKSSTHRPIKDGVKLPGIVLDGFGSALGMMIIAQIVLGLVGQIFWGRSEAEARRSRYVGAEISQMDVYPLVN